MKRAPLIGVVTGSKSDCETLQSAIEILDEFSGDRQCVWYAVPSRLSRR
jgi:phosphoribosylcarboxyaminoimidazole (NCAIR) mutase